MAETSIVTYDPASPVLIVDDSVQYAKVLRKLLSVVLGCADVTAVESPGEAYPLVAERPGRFGLLFVDFNFPTGETGGSFLERIGAEGLLRGTTAFLITSEPSTENVRQAVTAGAAGVVAKPFDRGALKEQLDKAARRRFAASQDYFEW